MQLIEVQRLNSPLHSYEKSSFMPFQDAKNAGCFTSPPESTGHTLANLIIPTLHQFTSGCNLARASRTRQCAMGEFRHKRRWSVSTSSVDQHWRQDWHRPYWYCRCWHWPLSWSLWFLYIGCQLTAPLTLTAMRPSSRLDQHFMWTNRRRRWSSLRRFLLHWQQFWYHQRWYFSLTL